jgi:hypothetical protein
LVDVRRLRGVADLVRRSLRGLDSPSPLDVLLPFEASL